MAGNIRRRCLKDQEKDRTVKGEKCEKTAEGNRVRGDLSIELTKCRPLSILARGIRLVKGMCR